MKPEYKPEKETLKIYWEKEEVLKLIKTVLEIEAEFINNPNGPDLTICPFCYAQGGSKGTMETIKHEQQCGYLIAKDLGTNLI